MRTGRFIVLGLFIMWIRHGRLVRAGTSYPGNCRVVTSWPNIESVRYWLFVAWRASATSDAPFLDPTRRQQTFQSCKETNIFKDSTNPLATSKRNNQNPS